MSILMALACRHAQGSTGARPPSRPAGLKQGAPSRRADALEDEVANQRHVLQTSTASGSAATVAVRAATLGAPPVALPLYLEPAGGRGLRCSADAAMRLRQAMQQLAVYGEGRGCCGWRGGEAAANRQMLDALVAAGFAGLGVETSVPKKVGFRSSELYQLDLAMMQLNVEIADYCLLKWQARPGDAGVSARHNSIQNALDDVGLADRQWQRHHHEQEFGRRGGMAMMRSLRNTLVRLRLDGAAPLAIGEGAGERVAAAVAGLPAPPLRRAGPQQAAWCGHWHVVQRRRLLRAVDEAVVGVNVALARFCTAVRDEAAAAPQPGGGGARQRAEAGLVTALKLWRSAFERWVSAWQRTGGVGGLGWRRRGAVPAGATAMTHDLYQALVELLGGSDSLRRVVQECFVAASAVVPTAPMGALQRDLRLLLLGQQDALQKEVIAQLQADNSALRQWGAQYGAVVEQLEARLAAALTSAQVRAQVQPRPLVDPAKLKQE